jgi:uncharacterized protein (DUF2336 family)
MDDIAPASKLHHLISLASEPSSTRRRELLREVTDMFFTVEDGHGQAEMSLFDDVLTKLAGDMEEAVRAELAQRMAEAPAPPKRLISGLAADTITVAQPVLESSVLPEDVQLHIARTKGEEHLQALSRRQNLGATVTDAIVERGSDETLGVLLQNETAELSRQAQEVIVDRAQANPDLHQAVVDRQSLPLDLLNEMYFVVEAKLRERILEKNDGIDPAELERALTAGRKKVQADDGALPADYAQAEAAVAEMKTRGQITPQNLAAMLRNRETTKFLVALSQLADVDFHTARRILDRKELDALAIVCKAADFDRALFLTFAILILDKEADAMGRARQYGELYSNLPKDSALRTIRFWKMRRQTGDVAAA